MFLAVIIVILVLAAAGYLGFGVVRRRRTPDEVRGDWWPAFEREFREYVSRSADARRDDRRRRGEGWSAGR